MLRAFLLGASLVVIAACGVMLHANPPHLAANRISWPRPDGWAPESGPEIRGDALAATQAALGSYLQARTRAVHTRADACSDTARAMDVSFMVDEAQQLVFVKIDEAPQKRCPDAPPREFTDLDSGVIVVFHKPMTPRGLGGTHVYAVTFDGRIVDRYLPVDSLHSPARPREGGAPWPPDAGESAAPDAG